MEALPVSEEFMVIESHKGEYGVTFCEDSAKYLVNNLPDQNYHVIIDNRVADLYSDELQSILEHSSVLQIEALESNKSLESMPEYVTYLVNNQVRKNDILIAVGGGIIQDITCFLAATLLRGLSWFFYPTTLLAQADSCIGSKSSINCGDSKNLIGTFTPPKKVIIGNNFLETLSDKDVRSGVGEMLKVHAISGEKAFDYISSRYNQIFTDKSTMQAFIRHSLEIKKEYIELDEFDEGVRNIFNYGHSLGHAIEAATNFLIPHGIAITIGMDMANWLSPRVGDGHIKHYTRMHDILSKNYHGFKDVDIPIDVFMSALSKDKKNIGKNKVTLILPDKDAKIHKDSYVNSQSFRSLCDEYLTNVRFK